MVKFDYKKVVLKIKLKNNKKRICLQNKKLSNNEHISTTHSQRENVTLFVTLLLLYKRIL